MMRREINDNLYLVVMTGYTGFIRAINMHVHYSNTVFNTLRITETNMLSCYRQE
jgi:hypothetical protein